MDGSVIMRTYAKGTLRKHLAILQVCLGTFLFKDVEKNAILSLTWNNNHILEILGTCTNQGDTTNIDFLNNISITCPTGNSLLKRIQIDYD